MTKPAALLVCGIVVALTSCQTDLSRPNGRHRQPINNTSAPALPASADANVDLASAGVVSTGVAATTSDCTASIVPLVTVPDPITGETRVFRMFYDTGRSEFHAPTAIKADLLAQARKATHIVVKGRTDGKRYAPADEQVALDRALNARRFLIEHGVDPTRIDIQFASATDYLTENTSTSGRAQNRRVAIELELPRPSTRTAGL